MTEKGHTYNESPGKQPDGSELIHPSSENPAEQSSSLPWDSPPLKVSPHDESKRNLESDSWDKPLTLESVQWDSQEDEIPNHVPIQGNAWDTPVVQDTPTEGGLPWDSDPEGGVPVASDLPWDSPLESSLIGEADVDKLKQKQQEELQQQVELQEQEELQRKQYLLQKDQLQRQLQREEEEKQQRENELKQREAEEKLNAHDIEQLEQLPQREELLQEHPHDDSHTLSSFAPQPESSIATSEPYSALQSPQPALFENPNIDQLRNLSTESLVQPSVEQLSIDRGIERGIENSDYWKAEEIAELNELNYKHKYIETAHITEGSIENKQENSQDESVRAQAVYAQVEQVHSSAQQEKEPHTNLPWDAPAIETEIQQTPSSEPGLPWESNTSEPLPWETTASAPSSSAPISTSEPLPWETTASAPSSSAPISHSLDSLFEDDDFLEDAKPAQTTLRGASVDLDSLLDDDFLEEPSAQPAAPAYEQTNQTQGHVPHSAHPMHLPAQRGANKYSNPSVAAAPVFVPQKPDPKLLEKKTKSDFYDFPAPLIHNKVKPAARTGSNKYASSPVVNDIRGTSNASLPSRDVSNASVSSANSSLSAGPPVPKKDFFGELPVTFKMTKPARAAVVEQPKVETKQFQPHQQYQQQSNQRVVASKPPTNPYKPAVSQSPQQVAVHPGLGAPSIHPGHQVNGAPSSHPLPSIPQPPPAAFPQRNGYAPANGGQPNYAPHSGQPNYAPNVYAPNAIQSAPPNAYAPNNQNAYSAPHDIPAPSIPQSAHVPEVYGGVPQNSYAPKSYAPNAHAPTHAPNVVPNAYAPNSAPNAYAPNLHPQGMQQNLQHNLPPQNMQHGSPAQPFPSVQARGLSPLPLNTNLARSQGANSANSATSPYVPNAGPYAPSLSQRTHSRASSLVGVVGKDVNPYAPVPQNIQQPYQQVPHLPTPGARAGAAVTATRMRAASKGGIYGRKNSTAKVDPESFNQRQFPIFNWGTSQNVVYLIPSTAPVQYNIQSAPNIQIKQISSFIPDKSLSSFPGPLSKSKKKVEVEKWLEEQIFSKGDLLAQVLLTLLKNDGNVSLREFAREIGHVLNPAAANHQPTFSEAQPTVNAYKLDNSGINTVFSLILVGDVDRALEFAISRHDWAMALVIANFSGPEKFAKIALDYARSSFPIQNTNNKVVHIMPILLKIFAGNIGSVVDDLNAVAAEGDYASANWREIIASVIVSASVKSNEFLVEFGKFLKTRGNILGYQVCFLVALVPLAPGTFPFLFTELYTEVYEYILTLQSPGQFPHLLPMKLRHAATLADYGLFSESQKYVDWLNTKANDRSPFVNALFQTEIRALITRINVSSNDLGWFSSRMSKVDVWGQLDRFIGGVEQPAAKSENGVFSKFSPSVSRTASTADFSVYQNPTQTAYTEGISFATPAQGNPNIYDTPSIQASSGAAQARQVSKYSGLAGGQSIIPVPPALQSQASSGTNPYDPSYKKTLKYGGTLSNYGNNSSSSVNSQLLSQANPQADHLATQYHAKRNSAVGAVSELAQPAEAVRASPRKQLQASRYQLVEQGLQPNQRVEQGQLKQQSPQFSQTPLQINQSSPLNPHSQLRQPPNLFSQPLTQIKQEPTHVSPQAQHIPLDQFNAPAQPSPEVDSVSSQIQPSLLVEAQVEAAQLNTDEQVQQEPIGLQDIKAEISPIDSNYAKEATSETFSLPPIAAPKRVNPYAPGASSTVKTARNKYGPTKKYGAPANSVKPLQHENSAPNETFKDVKVDAHTFPIFTTDPTSPPPASNFAPSPRIKLNVDISFDEVDDLDTNHVKTPIQKQLFLNNISPPGANSMFDPFQQKNNLGSFGEFPIPGSPDYTTRANSVVGGHIGGNSNHLYSSKLSQSQQSVMYQQYEVEDDTVRDYVPLVEDEEDEDEDPSAKLERKKKEDEDRKARMAADKVRQKANEAAAKRATHANNGDNGWFTWMGRNDGKPKPIKAKLGEKNHFYYDEALGRWIDKNKPVEEQLEVDAPPPPPAMKKPAAGRPSGPPTNGLPKAKPPSNAPPLNGPPGPSSASALSGPPAIQSAPALTTPGPNGTPSGPPSIAPAAPKSNLANAGLDDLLSMGGSTPGGRKAKRSARRGYVNVMEK